MKIEIPDYQSDERGVSPVIGVILMVAITVILAAVIGAFVLDLGSQLGSTGPQSQLTIADHDDNLQPDDGSLQTAALVEHKGGDDLKAGELKVVIQKGGTTVATLEGPGWSASSGGQTIKFLKASGGSVPAADDEFTVGDSWVVEETADDGSTTSPGLMGDGTYTIKVIHKPSNSVIATSQIDIS